MKKLNRSSWRYWCIRLGRHHGDPGYISRGMAVGIFCAFATPILQMVLAIGLAFLVRGAKIPAVLGTWLSNWFTTPLLLPFQCYLGSLIIGDHLSWGRINQLIRRLLATDSISDFIQVLYESGNGLLTSFLVGGVAFGLLLAIPGYLATYWIVQRHRAAKAQRKLAACRHTINP